jgi:hypothetical protein
MENAPVQRRKKRKKLDARLSLRITQRLLDEIQTLADLEGRSLNGQILYQLAKSVNRLDLLK